MQQRELNVQEPVTVHRADQRTSAAGALCLDPSVDGRAGVKVVCGETTHPGGWVERRPRRQELDGRAPGLPVAVLSDPGRIGIIMVKVSPGPAYACLSNFSPG